MTTFMGRPTDSGAVQRDGQVVAATQNNGDDAHLDQLRTTECTAA